MNHGWIARTNVAFFVATLAGGLLFAQQKPAEPQHEHSATQAQGAKSGASDTSDAVSAAMSEEMAATSHEHDNEVAIFCPTMKTGQLCSHGTMNILQLKGEKGDQWLTLARKYNKAVDAATLELFKDAESTLTKEQLDLLKAWFAVGLNPQINELLYSKGLGPKK
jgi:hypothetical protein